MKKILNALVGIDLVIALGSGVLYSVGNDKSSNEVKLPESQMEDFGLRTVERSQSCYCSGGCYKDGRMVGALGTTADYYEQKIPSISFPESTCRPSCNSWCEQEGRKKCPPGSETKISMASCI